MEATLKRLYVGGIGPSVSDAELSERFGRFGKVDAVDIISRKDDQGNPVKTFAYLNINISDADLRKCLSVLNKTKWKGGVLQIEIAKESFLHKLEQERQATKEMSTKEQSHPKNDLLESLEKAGITDFQMKAAVPGTEVPNHKNWVVSKYGRVLPVLHLKGNKQSKIIKYDPSKYCHNLKKLDNISLESTPVSKLTWHLDGGDDDISKKRRGEFPEFKSPAKKSKVNLYLNTSTNDEKGKGVRTPPTTLQKTKDTMESQHKRETFQDKSRGYMRNKSVNSMSDEDFDSEEELRAIIEREKMVEGSGRRAEDSSIEVVDDSFTPSYKTHWAEKIGNHNDSTKDDDEYSSADTDEIITVAKTTQNCSNGKKKMSNGIAKQNSNVVSTNVNNSKCSVNDEVEDRRAEEDDQSNDSGTEDDSDSYSDDEYQSMMQNCYRLDLSIGDLEALAKEADESDSTDKTDSDQEYGSAGTDISIDELKSMQHDTVGQLNGSDDRRTTKKKSNEHSRALEPGNSESSMSHSESESRSMEHELCQANLAVDKLKSLEKSVSTSSADDGDDTIVVTSAGDKALNKTQQITKINKVAVGSPKKKKGIEPEDIVASILEDDDDDDDSSNDQPKRKKKTKNPPIKPPAFKGLGSLMSSLSCSKGKDGPESSSKTCSQPTTIVTASNEKKGNRTPKSKVKQDSKNHGEKTSKPVRETPANLQQRSEIDGSSSSSSDESSGGDDTSPTTTLVAKPKVPQKSSSNEQINAKAKQLQDNQKRLAAMEERRKEREQQKQTIQGALHKLDSQPAKKSQHIMFNSESEEESEKEEEASTSNVHDDKENHVKTQLFDSSGEDSDDEEEKDDERFELKTYYEGRYGEKLMRLQSRFGTDERFKMDARFLEDGSEDEEDTEQPQMLQADDDADDLSAEKKKNLDILKNVLNVNVEPQLTNKKTAKAKTFKDLNALQYDPSKEDHALFETKAETEKTESKSERKKKRLEAEKLPEVSKEIFHEVIADFKDVFGAVKPQAAEEQETTWDQMEDPQKMEDKSSESNVDFEFQKKEEPVGFTFSFFGTSTDENVSQDEPYRIEPVKMAKVAWQEDPRFQDSSSDGEGEDEDTTVDTSSQLERSSSIRFFFFVKDDKRLKEGPKMFLRSSKYEPKSKDWDHMRETIMEACKKRHRDAKRKLKSKR
ncbi:nucleolar protein 8 [Eleutherodactylus coqui]|uniref:nucleolar protein 8 n=1 Tax=Eleutherodactylus coqui TaxID=57060 RepID=UPI0034629947